MTNYFEQKTPSTVVSCMIKAITTLSGLTKKYKNSVLFTVLVAGLGLSLMSFSSGNFWSDADYKEVSREAREKNMPICLLATNDDAAKDQMMGLFSNPQVQQYLGQHFITKRLSSTQRHDRLLLAQLDAPKYPCLIFMNAKGEVLLMSSRFSSPDALITQAQDALTFGGELKSAPADKTATDGELIYDNSQSSLSAQ